MKKYLLLSLRVSMVVVQLLTVRTLTSNRTNQSFGYEDGNTVCRGRGLYTGIGLPSVLVCIRPLTFPRTPTCILISGNHTLSRD